MDVLFQWQSLGDRERRSPPRQRNGSVLRFEHGFQCGLESQRSCTSLPHPSLPLACMVQGCTVFGDSDLQISHQALCNSFSPDRPLRFPINRHIASHIQRVRRGIEVTLRVPSALNGPDIRAPCLASHISNEEQLRSYCLARWPTESSKRSEQPTETLDRESTGRSRARKGNKLVSTDVRQPTQKGTSPRI